LLNKDNLFRAPMVNTKASKTHSIAMGIVEAEADARAEKSRRLRAARAERDASEKIQLSVIPKQSSRRNSRLKSNAIQAQP